MLRRTGRTLGSLLLLGASGCALLQIVMLPFQLLFSLLGAAGGAVGICDVRPVTAPPPVVENVAPDQWRVTGLRADVSCRIVCTAEGVEPRVYEWPRDFAGSGEDVLVQFDGTR
jgi:hypothetical protein